MRYWITTWTGPRDGRDGELVVAASEAEAVAEYLRLHPGARRLWVAQQIEGTTWAGPWPVREVTL